MSATIPPEKYPALLEAIALDYQGVQSIVSARAEDSGAILCIATTESGRVAVKLDRENISVVPLGG
jgi:hypothetical protein